MKSVTLKSRIVSRSTSPVISSPAKLRGTLPRPSSGLMPTERLSWVHLQARDSLVVPGSQSPKAWWEPICIPVTHPITSATGTLCSRRPSTSLSVSISHYAFFPMGLGRLLYHCHVHDDAMTWKHFPRYWPFVRGIHWSPVNSPHKGQWRGVLMLKSGISQTFNFKVNSFITKIYKVSSSNYGIIYLLEVVMGCIMNFSCQPSIHRPKKF